MLEDVAVVPAVCEAPCRLADDASFMRECESLAETTVGENGGARIEKSSGKPATDVERMPGVEKKVGLLDGKSCGMNASKGFVLAAASRFSAFFRSLGIEF